MNTKKITVSAIIAAMYAVLTIVLMPVTGEFRIAEALCVLPWFIPETAFGLFAGCLISNIFTGNVYDILFGSLATLVAGICTSKAKNMLLACLMPVFVNGLMVGAVLHFGYGIENLLICILSVAIPEAVIMLLIGFPLMKILSKRMKL